MEKCDDTVTNRKFEDHNDIPALTGLVMKSATGAKNDKVCPALQAALVWSTHCSWVHEKDKERLLQCPGKFLSDVEHVENVNGGVNPNATMVAGMHMRSKKESIGRNKEEPSQ